MDTKFNVTGSTRVSGMVHAKNKSVERSQMYVLTFIVFYCFLLSWIILHPNLYDF